MNVRPYHCFYYYKYNSGCCTNPTTGDPLLLPTVVSISGNLEHTLLFSEFYCTGGRHVAVTETYHVTIWRRLSQTRINVGT